LINIIWVSMFVIGVVFAMVNGTMTEVNEAIFSGAKEAVTICIGLISVLAFWLGMMKIAEKAGLLDGLGKLLRPLARRLFPDVPVNDPAMGYILSNITANLFGLGNAATPMGIKAMKELRRLNLDREEASRSMITLLAINTSGITLIPTTVIALRMNYDSLAPTEIVGTTLVASTIAVIAAVFIDRFYYYRHRARR